MPPVLFTQKRKEVGKMRKTNVRKLAVASVFCAVAVVGSLFSFPVFGSKCAPVQHMVNILCAVLLGPGYGVAAAFADSRVLDKLSARALAEGMFATADECSDYAASAANCAYELTFLLAGIVCFVYVVLIRKQKLIARQEAPKYAGAAFETAGQFAYIFALSDTAHVAISAPIISAYCVASVVWSRIFLKEKLSLKHYLMIALVVAGIVILGVYDA